MSELSGNLQDFPLPDVLRLLAKSRKDGVLHVYGDSNRGRVYLDEGRVSYATTRVGDDFADADTAEAQPGQGERARIQLGGMQEADPGRFEDHLRAQIVEVLVRLGREHSGNFVFQNGVTPAEPVPQPLDVEVLLSEAEAELKEWTRIEGIIGSTTTPITMVGTLEPDRTVTLDGHAWNALAVMAGSATARDVADQLGQFEIVAARTVARLVELGLLEVVGQATAPPPEPTVALSERETMEVLSALTADPTPEPPSPSDDSSSVVLVEENPAASANDGWEGLEDPEPEPAAEDPRDDQPPASELARRWRSLRSNN